eukprot:GHVS01076174.1.p1 GENE.GHVS01076174.1~~GHVS01076174.1.p1  ORF type:complete len:232 (-),score=27.95 GHVS01076174.1:35-730(-)
MGNSDSKLVLREHLEKLVTQPVKFEDDAFWQDLFGVPLSVGELFELVAPDDVRKLRNERPLNASFLFKRIIYLFQNLIDESSRGKHIPGSAEKAITCVRLITRIMPFLLEDPDTDFIHVLFWRPGGYVPAVQQEFKKQAMKAQQHGEAIEAASGGDESGGAVAEEDSMVIGAELLVCLVRLLFLRGFCVGAEGIELPSNEPLPKHKVDARFLWKGRCFLYRHFCKGQPTCC